MTIHDSTQTLSKAAVSHRAGASSAKPVTLWRVMRSEWLKLTTTRTAMITLVSAAVAMIGIGYIASATLTGAVDPSAGPAGGPSTSGGSGPLATVMAGQMLAMLIIGVLGVVLGTREYSSGLIRTTASAVPKRGWILAAKAFSFIGFALPIVAAGVFGTFFVGMATLSSGGADTLALSDPGVLSAVLGSIAYLVGVGVFGLLLGMFTRGLGVGIGILVVLLMILPGLGSVLLPESWQGALDYLPSNAAEAFTTVAGTDAFSAATGVGVFAAWLLCAAVLAGGRLLARDV